MSGSDAKWIRKLAVKYGLPARYLRRQWEKLSHLRKGHGGRAALAAFAEAARGAALEFERKTEAYTKRKLEEILTGGKR